MSMTLPNGLTLSEEKKPRGLSDRQRLRQRIIEGLKVQKRAAQAELNGEEFQATQKRWAIDSKTGEKVLKEMPIRFRKWWWRDDENNVLLGIRYGYKFISLDQDHASIVVGKMDDLEAIIDNTIAAIDQGSFDEALLKAMHERCHKK